MADSCATGAGAPARARLGVGGRVRRIGGVGCRRHQSVESFEVGEAERLTRIAVGFLAEPGDGESVGDGGRPAAAVEIPPHDARVQGIAFGHQGDFAQFIDAAIFEFLVDGSYHGKIARDRSIEGDVRAAIVEVIGIVVMRILLVVRIPRLHVVAHDQPIEGRGARRVDGYVALLGRENLAVVFVIQFLAHGLQSARVGRANDGRCDFGPGHIPCDRVREGGKMLERLILKAVLVQPHQQNVWGVLCNNRRFPMQPLVRGDGMSLARVLVG